MKKLRLTVMLLLLIPGVGASAQSYQVPKDYALKTKEDYAKYEPDIIKTVDWLQQASWSEPLDNRRPANAFLVAWTTGSPNVSISIGPSLTKLADKNPELLMIFMGGYTKYALQHKSDFDNNQANLAGLRAMIEKYNKESARIKDSAMEKLIKVDKGGKLEEWTKTDFLKT